MRATVIYNYVVTGSILVSRLNRIYDNRLRTFAHRGAPFMKKIHEKNSMWTHSNLHPDSRHSGLELELCIPNRWVWVT